MRLLAVLILLASPAIAFEDQYGGTLPAAGAATGRFYVTEVGDRWMLVTPEGNGMWHLGIYNVAVDGGEDILGSSYTARVATKYGDSNVTWGPQTVRRLGNWGFNSLVDYTNNYAAPYATNPGWPGDDTQPIKMAATTYLLNANLYSRSNHESLLGNDNLSPKELYWGVNTDYYTCYAGGTFTDIYDDNFDVYLRARMGLTGSGYYFGATFNNAWVIGATSDETDYLYGFGAGADWVTQPSSGKENAHLGFVILITSPTQTNNRTDTIDYADTEVFSKTALEDFLKAKYTTIGNLNTAWGSSYSTWGSAGTWGVDDGFMDEDGFNAWVNTDCVDMTGMDQDIIDDLDDFLYVFALKYFTVYDDAFDDLYPTVMFLGPTNLGSWGVPPRKEILQAASGKVDILRLFLNDPDLPIADLQDKVDFVETHFGNGAWITWIGATANADSMFYDYPEAGQHAYTTTPETQAGKVTWYSTIVDNLWDVETAGGHHPFVGISLWEFHDSRGEKANWGVASLSDNVYDGYESTSNTVVDPWGYTTSPEYEGKSYGNYVDTVRATNLDMQNRIGFGVDVEQGSTTATVGYGTHFMQPDVSCSSVIKTDPGGDTIDTHTHTTGPSYRQAEHTGLTAATDYTANLTCDGYTYDGVSFSTTAAAGGTANHTYGVGTPSALLVGADTLTYTCTDQDGGCETYCTPTATDGSCGSGCSVTVELASGRLYECQHTWLDDPGGNVIGTGLARYVATE